MSLLIIVFAAAVAVALVVWTIRIYGGAHRAWAQGLYGADDPETRHDFAGVVQRLAARRSRRSS